MVSHAQHYSQLAFAPVEAHSHFILEFLDAGLELSD